MINESLRTIVLAQIIGLYLIIMAVIMLAKANYYRNLLQTVHLDKGVTFIAASGSLALGLFLMIIHNIWIMESEVLITLVAWFILIKSVLWLAIPETMLLACRKFHSGVAYYLWIVIMAIIGILLTAHGFYLFL